MALRNQSLFLYNLQVTVNNQSIDFLNVALGTNISALVPIGFYSLASLATAIASAMNTADITNTYTVTVTRTTSSGTQNRVTIATSGAFLSLDFASGPLNGTSIAPLIGFSGDQTGATTYTGTATAGTALLTTLAAYNYLGPYFYNQVQGTVNISAAGVKEAIVFQIQQFIQTQYKYEAEAGVISNWNPFWTWAIQQRPFDFTPDYKTDPTTFYSVTLEKTGQDSKGIGFKMTEMIPKFPFLYDTGLFEMRVIIS